MTRFIGLVDTESGYTVHYYKHTLVSIVMSSLVVAR
jgi:hypothetical protein